MSLLLGASVSPALARRGSSVVCAASELFNMGGWILTSRPNILEVASVMASLDFQLEDIMSLRAACRSLASEEMTVLLCHWAFHEKDLMLDPCSDPCLSIWSRCIELDD